MVIVFGANLATCFGSSELEGDAPAVTPRAINEGDSTEVSLARPLTTVWVELGRSEDDLYLAIVDEPEINAASFGQGRFLLWQGLNLVTEEGQYAIAAHEIAHDQLHHSKKVSELRDVADFLGSAIATVGQSSESEQLLQQWSANIVIPKYSRAQELEADSNAIEILRRIEFPDPRGALCRVFVQLKAVEADEEPGFFSSHPALADRIARLRGFSTSTPSPTC